MHKFVLSITALSLLSACNLMPTKQRSLDPVVTAPPLVESTSLDEGTEEAVAEAKIEPAFSGPASTIAGLGDPTQPGLWMETPLVTAEQKARVTGPSGAAVILTLRPIAGEISAGSRLSIDAMRALGAPLTELVTLQVSAAG